MKSGFKVFAVTWAVLLIIFIAVAVLMPILNYAALALSVLAFVVQLGCSYFVFKEKDLNKVFLGIPTVVISYVGVVVMAVAGIGIAFIYGTDIIGTIICFIILLINIVAVLLAKGAAGAIEAVDAQVKQKTMLIKNLTAEAQSVMGFAATPADKATCSKVYEALRYSDPMSNDGLKAIDNQLVASFSRYYTAVKDGVNVEDAANELLFIISDRNNKCKLFK